MSADRWPPGRRCGWLLTCLLPLAAASTPEALFAEGASTGITVARHADGLVTCQELRDAARSPGSPRPSDAAGWRELAEQLVVERALVRDARKTTTETIGEIEARARRFRQRELISALEAELSRDLEISPAQIRALYEQEPERVYSPRKLVSRFLLRRIPEDASPERQGLIREETEALRRRFLAGEAFADLAREHSEAENASRGGLVAARPRGTLLAAYEDVAWQMEPGQISRAVRLPEGWALILVESFLPERRFTLEEATPRLRNHLEKQELDRRRESLLAEARRRWPASHQSSSEPSSSGNSEAFLLGGQTFTLRDLGLQHRPPRLERRIAQALDQERLALLARDRLDLAPEIERQATRLARALLARQNLAQRVEAALPEVPETTLRQLYEQRKKSLRTLETRTFEGWFFASTDGQLRAAHGLATTAAEAWRRGDAIPPGGEPIRWGPFPRTTLGNSVSPRFAAAAFGQEPEAVGQPLRMESYDPASLRFRAEGYVVLRARVAEPERIPSFAAAHQRLLRIALRREIPHIEQRIRRRILEEEAFEMQQQELSRCLEVPEEAPLPAKSSPDALQESRPPGG